MKHNTYIAYFGMHNVTLETGIFTHTVNAPIFVIVSYDDISEDDAKRDMEFGVLYDVLETLDKNDIRAIEYIGQFERDFEDANIQASYNHPFNEENKPIWESPKAIRFIMKHLNSSEWHFALPMIEALDHMRQMEELDEYRKQNPNKPPF